MLKIETDRRRRKNQVKRVTRKCAGKQQSKLAVETHSLADISSSMFLVNGNARGGWGSDKGNRAECVRSMYVSVGADINTLFCGSENKQEIEQTKVSPSELEASISNQINTQ